MRLWIAFLGVVDTAFVAKLSVRIEDKNVWRHQDPKGERDFLRFTVEEIGKFESGLLCTDLHVLKRVTQISVSQLVQSNGFGVVG